MIIVVNVTINTKKRTMAQNKQLKLEQFLPFRLVNAADTLSLMFAERYRKKYGLTRPEWRSFAILGENNNITATDVGAISGMHKTKVSRAVASLAARGWVSRRRNTSDRRIENLVLTCRGKTQYKKMALEAQTFEQDIESRLGPKGVKIVWQAIDYLDALDADRL